MLIRRLTSSSALTSPLTPAERRGSRSTIGMTMWFDTMIDSAMLATITIEVAEENPPMNTSRASALWSCSIGRVRTNMSGFEPAGRVARPTIAIGRVNRLVRNRYSGNSQPAVRRWFSSAFSTTVIWNCRGRQTIAVADRKVRATQRVPKVSEPCSTAALVGSANTSGTPPAIQNTTYSPTASSANSLTSASTAIAATTP